ncbi:MAG: GNAT family N-acetyltransferase [Steroidobacteraceae bacterium]
MNRSADESIQLVEQFPDVDDYLRIGALAGLTPRTETAARRGLANTLYGVSLKHDNEVIGMGRVIGDNGCVFMVVDIAIIPTYQGRGLGTRIMVVLDHWIRRNVPETAYVTLVANGEARNLYAKFGFAQPPADALYMEYIMGPATERPIR